MEKITIEEAIKLLKEKPDFGKTFCFEIENGKINGNYFGIIDDNYIEQLKKMKGLSAYTSTTNHGTGMEGGITREVRIIDKEGHGFEEVYKIGE